MVSHVFFVFYMLFSTCFMFIHCRYKSSVTRYIPVTGRHFPSHFMKGVSIRAVVLELNSPKTLILITATSPAILSEVFPIKCTNFSNIFYITLLLYDKPSVRKMILPEAKLT